MFSLIGLCAGAPGPDPGAGKAADLELIESDCCTDETQVSAELKAKHSDTDGLLYLPVTHACER